MSVQRRLNVGFIALLILFVVLLLVQFGLGTRMRSLHDSEADRAARAEIANDQVLQRMTDAETGIRGYLLTGEQAFLEPYEKGWTAALAALDDLAHHVDGAAAQQLLGREREAVHTWLDDYAAPIVAARSPGADAIQAVRGKAMFDEFRVVNAALDAAVDTERRRVAAASASSRASLDLAATILVVAIMIIGVSVARTGRRELLVPLARLGMTIRRLAEGDRSARAEPAGADELRTIVEALNDLAAQTETLLAAEQARAARAGLRQAVATEMQEMTDPAATGGRIAELVGAAVGAEAVHTETVVPGTGTLHAGWPAGTPELPGDLTTEMLAARPGHLRVRPDGGIWLVIGGDPDCPRGYLYVRRPGAPVWTEAEQRLLSGVVREIERALRQLSLQDKQARLITELRMLDQRKDVFIQTVTHELRTPLTSILGYTEMITDEDGGELTTIQQRALNAILRNAHRLHDTIGDLILLDRPGQEATGHPDVLDLAGLAMVVRGELANAAKAKELTVTFDAEEGWVRGDRTQLQRALRKLMENAIKFTPAGGSVDCHLTADARSVSVSVTDTGIGIPAEDVPGLFTPFHRAGNAMDQAVQGPGLGLAIVRDIVRDHGGTIAVQSVVGRGSTFTVTLPAAPAPAEPRSPARV
ncbi:ATP-binding protein [Actinoplanes subglobosus]|uniref:Sensor-like histidine kinase SenX3 n=1 Tax=Actinoplanes subglobosus TaxID=1547892 RepID=A0ABV8J8X4_9ACTN